MTAQAGSARVPVSLVTGFLGSGKTTLIAALLKQPAMDGTAVVVNEFGAVGIDDAIFAEALDEDNVVLLANGCLCCAPGDDLARTVWNLTRRQPKPPRRIVIETSGMADPAAALRRLMGDPRLRQAIRLDALVATVDAVNGLKSLDEQPVAQRQCAVADRRLITKTDLAGPSASKALAERLLALNPGAPVAFVSHGEIDADRLFGASLFNSGNGDANADRWLGIEGHRALPDGDADGSIRFSRGPAHDHAVGSWLIEEARPVDWDVLSPRLGDIVARHGDRLLRVKGIVRTVGDERPLVIHGVQRVFHAPVRLQRWTRAPATSIVVIGDSGARTAIELIAGALGRAAVARSNEPGAGHGTRGPAWRTEGAGRA
jgi:G3E family GTPase